MRLRFISLLLSLFMPLLLFSYPKHVRIISNAEHNEAYNLTETGFQRSDLIPSYLSSLTDQGLAVPDIIFVTQRSLAYPGFANFQTATPSSKTFITPIHVHSSSDIPGLVDTVLHSKICNNKSVLIVWDFATIPQLISSFGYTPPNTPCQTCFGITYLLDQFPAESDAQTLILNQALLPSDSGCGGVIVPPPPAVDAVANYIPVTIYNGTLSATIDGTTKLISPDKIFILVQTDSSTKVLKFTKDAQGHMLGSEINPSPIAGNRASYYTSFYSYPLSSFQNLKAGFYTFYLPTNGSLISSRIFFSLINPIDWFVENTGHVRAQDDNFITTDNTYYTLYDKIEFNIKPISIGQQLVMNSTAVDYYCLPLSFYINYKDYSSKKDKTSYTGISPTIRRQNVFDTYATSLSALKDSASSTWGTLHKTYTSPNGTKSNLRIASANTGTLKPSNVNPIFPKNYLQANPYSTCQWLSKIWYNASTPAYYQSQTLTLDLSNAGAGAGKATGSVNGSGSFVFTFSNDSKWHGGTVTFQLPQTCAPFFSGAFTDYVVPGPNTPLWSVSAPADNSAVEAVWQIFSCAFSVGLLPPPSPTGSVSNPLTKSWLQSQVTNFYKDNSALCPGPWYNFYSKVLHENFSISPHLDFYTAPFDDFLNIDGTIFVDDLLNTNSKAAIFVTIGDMTNSVIPNILSDSTSYNVTFTGLPVHVKNVTFNGKAVPALGGSMGSTTGSSMALSLEYTTGVYAGTTFTAQISPSTQTTTPALPFPANITLSGKNLTISLGGP